MPASAFPFLSLQPSDTLTASVATPIASPPWDAVHLPSSGQSLSIGSGDAAESITHVTPGKSVSDSLGIASGYDITKPNATTLSLIDLVAPIRAPGGGGQYPSNIGGENVDVSWANAAWALAQFLGFTTFTCIPSAVGQGAAAMSVVKKGGSGNAYAAALYESQVARRFCTGTFGVGAYAFTHGEQDAANFSATYQADLIQLWSDLNGDLSAISGQTRPVPLLLSQQQSAPQAGFGPNLTSQAMWLASQQSRHIVLVGPKYQYAYSGDRVHLSHYRPLGEKYAQVLIALWQTGSWFPLMPTSIARVGTTVTVSLNVPVAPIVFDTNATGPHLSGGLSVWGPGKGFEAYDAPQAILGATGNGVSPIVLQVADSSNYTTNQTVYVSGNLGNTNANGAFACTVVDPTHISLQGTTGNGAWSAGAGGAQIVNVIGINSATISGPSIALVLSRTPTTGLVIAYADTPDAAYGTSTGGYPDGRCGLVRDSDPYVGPTFGSYVPTAFANFNWLIEFRQAVP